MKYSIGNGVNGIVVDEYDIGVGWAGDERGGLFLLRDEKDSYYIVLYA